MKKCIKCGTIISDETKICCECGEPLTIRETDILETGQEMNPIKRNVKSETNKLASIPTEVLKRELTLERDKYSNSAVALMEQEVIQRCENSEHQKQKLASIPTDVLKHELAVDAANYSDSAIFLIEQELRRREEKKSSTAQVSTTINSNIYKKTIKIGSLEDEIQKINECLIRKGVSKTFSINRSSLNSIFFLGIAIPIFIFVPFFVVFPRLGKRLMPLSFLFMIFIVNFVMEMYITNNMVVIGFVYLLIYIIYWAYANIVLADNIVKAEYIIEKIDKKLALKKQDVEYILEKGLLQMVILGQYKVAIETFNEAQNMSGGDPKLWNFAGMALRQKKIYTGAKQFFDRAEYVYQIKFADRIQTYDDLKLIKRINKNQNNVNKKVL